MNEYYPIAVFCYNRPVHLQRTIEALKNNEGAAQSELWIFSDGPARKEDYDSVQAVRDFADKVSGFKNIFVIKSDDNKGLACSIIDGVSQVLQNASACIVLEDDLETSPYFLRFLNKGLSLYANDPDIFSISGYCPPIAIPEDYPHEAFRFPRINSWGWGTWHDRWSRVDWDVSDFDAFISNKKSVKKLSSQGKDLPVMLLKQQTGKIGSWAVRFNQACFEEGKTNIYPVRSLVRNMGVDGTGTHMRATKKYFTRLSEKRPEPLPARTNDAISKAFRHFYTPSFYRQVINKIKIALYLHGIH